MINRTAVILCMVSFRPLAIPADLTSILNMFMEIGGVYVPEIIGDQETYRHSDVAQLERNWIGEGSIGGLLFKRKRPFEVNMVLTIIKEDLRSRAPNHLFVSIDGSYFDSAGRLTELVELGNSVYDFLLPCYGFIELPWMPSLKASTLPDRGIPGWGWATWLGPEYDTIIQLPPLAGVSLIHKSTGGRLIQLPYPETVSLPDTRCLTVYNEILHNIDHRALQTLVSDSGVAQRAPLSSGKGTNGKNVAAREVLLPNFRYRD